MYGPGKGQGKVKWWSGGQVKVRWGSGEHQVKVKSQSELDIGGRETFSHSFVISSRLEQNSLSHGKSLANTNTKTDISTEQGR